MISFYRDDDPQSKTLFARIDLGVADSAKPKHIHFSLQMKSAVAAEIFKRQLNAQMEGLVAEAHRNGYRQGWADKAAKRRKATNFSGCFLRPGSRSGWSGGA